MCLSDEEGIRVNKKRKLMIDGESVATACVTEAEAGASAEPSTGAKGDSAALAPQMDATACVAEAEAAVKALDSINKLLGSGMTEKAAAQALGLPASNARRWLSKESELRAQVTDPKLKSRRGFGGPKRGKYEDVSKDFLAIYKRRRAEGFK
eukprot:gene30897-38731_t